MQLNELLSFDKIVVQAHDNPDADAIASGFAVYRYLKGMGKEVTLIYSGRYQIKKTNLKMMITQLDIPIEYRSMQAGKIDGLLLTVDCQYGAGNVYQFDADAIAIIDHHEKEVNTSKMFGWEIKSNLGSCSTLVWHMLLNEGFPVNDDVRIGTALYYGLYRDTNQFAELYYPLDMDMRESLHYDMRIIHLLRNSNMSLQELEIAGMALMKTYYDEDYAYSLIRTQSCDPNLLGLISDFLIQVDEIVCCVVFCELDDGYKYSVRSCTKNVQASEMARFLAEDIGSGGGHIDKAGGFINMRKYGEIYPLMHAETYFKRRLNEYFESFEIIEADKYDKQLEDMDRYALKPRTFGYAKTSDFFPINTEIIIRTIVGDSNYKISEDEYFVLSDDGKVKILSEDVLYKDYDINNNVCALKLEYKPRLKDIRTRKSVNLLEYMMSCVYRGDLNVYAKKICKGIKVFPREDEGTYMVGKPGDYLVIKSDNPSSMQVVSNEVFDKMYQEVQRD